MLTLDIIIRLIATFVLSSLFGLERESSHKPAGFGAFTFVAVTGCALGLVALTVFPDNPMALLSAIVTGTGFLGAGALIKTGNKILGFTTAASIWTFSIFGLMMATGSYLIALSLYVFVWVGVFIDRLLEKQGTGTYQKRVTISSNRVVSSKEVEELLQTDIKRQLTNIEFDKKNNKYSYAYVMEGAKDEMNKDLKKIFDKNWCDNIKVE
jgi:putative Mg2+ transporter-C (MgtC) family protein